MSPGLIDLVLIALLAGFTLKGFFSGFARSVISIAAVVLAWLAASLMPQLSAPVVASFMAPGDMAFPFATRFATWLAVFAGIQILGFLIGMVIKKSGLGGADRVAGLVLGAATGVFIGCLPLVMLYAMPGVYYWQPTQDLLRHSTMLKAYTPVVQAFLKPPARPKPAAKG